MIMIVSCCVVNKNSYKILVIEKLIVKCEVESIRTLRQFFSVRSSLYNIASYVLLKALPPVCMKYAALDESQVENIA